MAGLINENFKEEVLGELSWIKNAIDELSTMLDIETYETALIRYRIEPEEDQAIEQFFLLHSKSIADFKIEDIQKGIAKIYIEDTNKEWFMLDDVLRKLIALKREHLKSFTKEYVTKDNQVEIIRQNSSIFVQKDNGTKVNYFLFPEFEIHENMIPKNTIQDWHSHQAIEEVIIVTSGEIIIEVKEDENSDVISHKVITGDLIRVKQSIHRILNTSKQDSKFIVFRFVPEDIDKSLIIKNDKIYCE